MSAFEVILVSSFSDDEGTISVRAREKTTGIRHTGKEKDDGLKEELEKVKVMLPDKTQRAVDLACEKGASSWLTVIPFKTWILISTSGNFVML